MKTNITGRFAPSPSGYMHMGNLMAMLLAWLDSRCLGGKMIFRMEDLDPSRSKAKYKNAMAPDLLWLGLDWDIGWPDISYAQSERSDIYEDAFQYLKNRNLLYPCWCTRAERLAAASAPHPGEDEFDRNCRCAHLSSKEKLAFEVSGRAPAWKLRCPDQIIELEDGHYGTVHQNLARDVGDFIIRRSDGIFAYQLAVAVDDMQMGVTRVVRGRDLLSSAPRQKWLIETLGGTSPSYCHSPLLVSGNGKLSKRIGSLSTQILRQKISSEALCGILSFLCGLTETAEPVSPSALIPIFSWDAVKKEDIKINTDPV